MMNFNALQSHAGMLNGAIHPPALKARGSSRPIYKKKVC